MTAVTGRLPALSSSNPGGDSCEPDLATGSLSQGVELIPSTGYAKGSFNPLWLCLFLTGLHLEFGLLVGDLG
ncbi:hypothetical protein L1987_16014 [Smallanthus sonchifolius]|uniref:Uncharacterized protein n=1 Tax=Smallanthus sonchifolius TaxID=185202 RepID=A0ACB9J866_9ASTR|nr:hypothetical protein L1987_16014 [Smallanthus sonchifolius]